MSWVPPKSPFNLIQEKLHNQPWRLLIACIFCNQTKRVQAEPILWEFFERYPSEYEAASANIEELVDLLRPLGLYRRRATTIIRFSKEFIENDWDEDPKNLYGIGKYASDAWRIFCKGSWREVNPKDRALNDYHNFLKKNQIEQNFNLD